MAYAQFQKFSPNELSILTIILISGTMTLAHDPETGISTFAESDSDSVVSEFASRYESRYYSEGRDSLDGDPIWINSVEIGYGAFSGAVWYGNSPEQEYDELQLSLAATWNSESIQLSAGYTYLEFPFENSNDHEFGISIGFSGIPLGIEIGADLYYSLEASGYFMELSLNRELLSNDGFILNLAGIFGFNQGYVSDGHDGANHFALMLESEIEITDQLYLFLHTTYSWAIDVDPVAEGDSQLIDFFHGTVGMSYRF